MTNQHNKLVFLGVGQVAQALAALAAKESVFSMYGTTRSAERIAEISAFGIEPRISQSFENLDDLLDDALVVVSFPPDPVSDESACRAAANAKSIVYISSTAVYGQRSGCVDELTAVDAQSQHAKARLDAEQKWLQIGASVIRAPGIYGRGSGLHRRLMAGTYKMPGDGSNFVSRIHVDDLAQMIMLSLLANQKGQVLLCSDEKPATHREVVEWLVERIGLPFPESIPLEECHYTQRGNRRVDATKSLRSLSMTLKFPTYVEGYTHELAGA